MNFFKKIGLGIVFILMLSVLLVGLIIFLVSTTNGLHMILNGASQCVPGLKINSISGNWRDLNIKQLHYQIPGVTVDIDKLHLALDFSCLRDSKLCLNDLSIRDINIILNTAEFKLPALITQKVSSSISLSTPYPFNLRRLMMNNIQIKVNNTSIALDEFSIGFQFQGNNLIVTPTRVAGLLVSLPTAAQVINNKLTATMQPIKFDTRTLVLCADAKIAKTINCAHTPLAEILRVLFAKPLLPHLSSFTLPLNLTVEDIKGENIRFSGNINLLIKYLRFQAVTSNQYAELKLLDIDSSYGLLNASGNAEFSKHWKLSMTVNTVINSAPLQGEKIKLIVDGDLHNELRAILNFSGPLTAQLTLKTYLTQVGLPLVLTFNSQSIQWPLIGTPQYKVQSLALCLYGKARDYQLMLKAALNGDGLPPADVNLNAEGNTDGFTLPRLRLSTLQGITDLSTVIDWQNTISWRSELSLNKINTACYWPNWVAELNRKIISYSSLHGDNWQLQVPEQSLHDYIRQNQLTAKGSLMGNAAGQWKVPQLLLSIGCNQLTTKSELNNPLMLDAMFDAPALNNALPGLHGRESGNIKLLGNLPMLYLLIDLKADAFRWGELDIGHIALHGDIRSSDIVHSNIQLHLDKLLHRSLSITQLIINATGNEKQHEFKIAMKGNPISGHLQLNGSFNQQKQQWQGTISQINLATPMGDWQLTHKMILDYRTVTPNLIIGPHCWQNPNIQICALQNSEIGASGQTSLLINHFNLAVLKPLLPAKMQASGVFTGRADIRWIEGRRLPQGKLALVGNNIKINKAVHGKFIPIEFDTLTFNAVLGNNGLAYFDWLIKIADNGQFNGKVQIADPRSNFLLSGNININQISLALLNPLLSQGESIDGLINAALHFSGNIQKPQLYGKLGLEHFVIKSNLMPFAMADSHLAFSFNGTSSALQGVIMTTHGQANLTGKADWSRLKSWHAYIKARSNQMRITIPPMVQLDISPDIVLEAMPTFFTLNGKINIPWARIKVKDIPENVVGVSNDEVKLDYNLQPVADKKDTAIPITYNLLVHIGDNVRLDAFGLKAMLKGDLKIAQDKQGIGFNGQIDIPSGRFYAYGQNLIVNKGHLLFSGPVDQLYLNIEAIRNPDFTKDNIVAGIRITGLANQPKVEVFSDPIKSQQEALSYLLRGQGLDISGADSNIMTSMLIKIGLAQSGQVMGKIGKAFGVSELMLDTQGVGNSSQVVVSGYISTDLQVKYGIGIFDSLATLTLRYRLMPKLYLEAVSGLEQVLDLLYRFEF